jgi:hypothetical protein
VSYEVPTKSEERYKVIMTFLDGVEKKLSEQNRGLNKSEYRTLNEFKMRVHGMRFGSKPVLEYPHWADVYNRLQFILDQPRRVPIPGEGMRLHKRLEEEPNLVAEALPEVDASLQEQHE